MTRSLIVGASGGIGSALAEACEADGETVRLSRSADGLDVTDERSVAEVLGRLDGTFERIFIATGILAVGETAPEKKLDHVEADELAKLFAVNAIGPILLLKHLTGLLPRRETARIGVLSARVGSIGDNGIGGWYSYRASKAALNQLVRTAAIELARTRRNAVLVALHPGTVETPFTADYQGHHQTVSPQVAAQNLLRVLSSLPPEQTGSFFDQNGEAVVW